MLISAGLHHLVGIEAEVSVRVVHSQHLVAVSEFKRKKNNPKNRRSPCRPCSLGIFWVSESKKSFPPLVVIKVVALVIQSSGGEETNLSHLNANLSSAEDSVQ